MQYKRFSILFSSLLFFCACTTNSNKLKQDVNQIIFENIIENPNSSLDSLEFVLHNTINDSLLVEAHSKIFFKKVYSTSTDAKSHYERILQIGKKYDYAQAKGLNLKGIYFDVTGNYDAALKCYTESIKISHNKYPNIEGSAHNNIGLINWNRGNYKDAITHFKLALNYFKIQDKKHLIANALSNIGLIYLDINQADLASEYFQEALTIRRALDDQYGISVCLTNLAKCSEFERDFHEAINYLDSAEQIKIKLQDNFGLSNTLYNKAVSYQKLGEYDVALALLKRAEKLCLETEAESNNLTNIYIIFGEIYFAQKKKDKLENIISLTKNQLDKTKDERNLAYYYFLRSKAAELDYNFEHALNFYYSYDSIIDKIEGLEVKNAINLYETQYQNAEKKKDLAQAQLKIADEKLKSKQKSIWLMILATMTILSGIIFYFYRSKYKLKQQQLALENQLYKEQSNALVQEQRLEISRDLHDSLGAQLTFIQTIVDSILIKNNSLNPEISHKIETLSTFSENAITELKNTLWVLNSDTIYMETLKNKILNFIQHASEATDTIVIIPQFKISENFEIDSKQAVNIFRVIQEIINNSIKYSEATTCQLEFIQNDTNLSITLSDNGKGFIPELVTEKSNGLRNIQHRINVLGGTVQLSSQPNYGTTYSINIELDHD